MDIMMGPWSGRSYLEQVLKLECKLESAKDLERGACWATVHAVAKTQIRLSD